MNTDDERPGHDHGHGLAALALGALGVVYGDIGTSPLYAMKEAFSGAHALPPTIGNVYGVLSLVFWSLNFVISFKYIGFVMRADNRGEGGILALLALVRSRGRGSRAHALLIGLGLFGAALLYGDGIITPAISVLGAVEGMEVAAPSLSHVVVPMAVAILIGLFALQRHGTDRIGKAFGPVMLVWFLSIAALGLRGIAMHPEVVRAINPRYAVDFLAQNGMAGFLILGAVVLVITGGEALYADMGHFGKRPIRLAWFGVALPALLLNYFGQAALLIETPGVANPFFALVPRAGLYPLIGIATAAAVVASQALISGAFSLTQQAVQLGYSPRVTIVHTSRTEAGQIYVPEVNQALAVACVLLVLGFRSSSELAAAYGIAVTGTMMITTVLFYRVARDRWQWSVPTAGALCALFLVVDFAFFGANIVKFADGGWFPIVVALGVFTLMSTWQIGRSRISTLSRESSLPIDLFLTDITSNPVPRVPGTAVFLTSATDVAPSVLLHHLKHNRSLHQRVLLLSLVTEEIPQVATADRLEFRALGEGFWRVVGHYGFMESPDVPVLMTQLGSVEGPAAPGGVFLTQTSFYLGRDTIVAGRRRPRPGQLSRWRRGVFMVMARNAQSATAFFGLPPNRVVELGAQIQI